MYDKDMSEGKLIKESFYSNILNIQWEYNIYLPTGYDENKKYNLIYMLHGAEDSCNHWITHGTAYQTLNLAIESKTIEPTIVVFPEGSPNGRDSWYINSRIYNMQEAFEKELFPHIEKTYSIIDDRKCRSIGGLSMGGYGAIRFGLCYPEYFGSIFALSPAVFDYLSDDMKAFLYNPKASENSMEKMFLSIFADNNDKIDEELWNSLNYKALWDSYEKKSLPIKFFVSNGTGDTMTSIEHSRILDDFLKEKNAEYIYIEQKYLDHSWGAWATILPNVLRYLN